MNSRVLPALALILSVGIFFAYVKPTWSGPLKETKIAIENYEQALAAADEYKKKQNALASARNAIDQENLNKLSLFLPDSVDNVSLILDINALAARSGLSLANIDVVTNDSTTSGNKGTESSVQSSGTLQIARTSPVGFVDLSLSAIGTYSSLQAFLVGIEKSARLLDVRDITVKGSDTGVYNYQMIVRLYWLR
jgi:Tfp pilus assembly protein PilO